LSRKYAHFISIQTASIPKNEGDKNMHRRSANRTAEEWSATILPPFYESFGDSKEPF
jgi:hypothetical protein